jgi:hypothetical protein
LNLLLNHLLAFALSGVQVGGENFLFLRRMPAKIKKLRKERMGQRERESWCRRFATVLTLMVRELLCACWSRRLCCVPESNPEHVFASVTGRETPRGAGGGLSNVGCVCARARAVCHERGGERERKSEEER